MELDERKRKILYAIIRTYMETGEPVGSRTISKYSDLNLSSATIRNEMSDLEEMGYILQPHTSAGRIPSDKGYRLYVDHILDDKDQEIQEFKDLMVERTDKLEQMLQRLVKALAANTNYATMVSSPAVRGNKLKFIQLSKVNSTQILAVIMMEGNLVRNKVIDVTEELEQETVLKLNILLNSVLNGLSIEEINLGMIQNLKGQAGIHSELVASVIDAVAEVIHAEDEVKIYTSGATNIFRYPELSDNGKASEIINTFEEKRELTDLVNQTLENSDSRGIQVYIGQETPIEAMKNCSVVTATYELGDGLQGTIGIIGPKRMDYENVLKTLKTLTVSGDSGEESSAQESTEEAGDMKKKKKKEKWEEKIEELEDRVKRQMAEFDNFRKRTEKEKSHMYEVGARDVIEKILPVVDNFERGLATVPEEQKADPVIDGMDKIYRQLMTVLTDLGVTPIEAVGQEFDPNFHNAVMHVEDENLGENVVAEEFLKGYMYKELVIRHSMVKVAN